jgi:hypothetical protein
MSSIFKQEFFVVKSMIESIILRSLQVGDVEKAP